MTLRFLTVLCFVSVLIGCGGGSGGGNDSPAPANKWDEMRWDEGRWQ